MNQIYLALIQIWLDKGVDVVIGTCIDIISDNLELDDLQWLLREIEDDPLYFANITMDKLRMEISEKRDALLSNGYCPNCKNELTFNNIYEKHEVWGHKQICRVGSVAKCKVCGWKGE